MDVKVILALGLLTRHFKVNSAALDSWAMSDGGSQGEAQKRSKQKEQRHCGEIVSTLAFLQLWTNCKCSLHRCRLLGSFVGPWRPFQQNTWMLALLRPLPRAHFFPAACKALVGTMGQKQVFWCNATAGH